VDSSTHDLVLAGLAEQEEHRSSGFVFPSPALSAIQGLGELALVEVVRELRNSADVDERLLAARLLNQPDPPLPGTTIVELVREALLKENDGQVINWLVIALQYAGEPTALADLKRLADHADARVRFAVPGAFSTCSEEFGLIENAMIDLSKDGDRDTRWSAVFEVAAWMVGGAEIKPDEKARVLVRLSELAASDDDHEIRATAAEGLDNAARSTSGEPPPLSE
jgi:HEAT repeat protein